MKKMNINFNLKTLVLFVFLMTMANSLFARDYYQLKIYNLKDKTQESAMDAYLKNAYVPALHRAGIANVGIFKPNDEKNGLKIIVFIPLKKVDQFEEIETTLAKDKKYQAEGAEYINAQWDKPFYSRIESILIKAFDEMQEFGIPTHKSSKSERVYELRSYEGPTEKLYQKKVEMFNKGGEVTLFKQLEFQPIFFGEVISGSTMPNLMYLTTFSDMKSHDEHWKAFQEHPIWVELLKLEEYKNTVSKSVIQFLHPTDYSDL